MLLHDERRAPTTALALIVIDPIKEHTMNKDQAKGRIEEVKGKVRQVAGKISGDKNMEKKGKIQNAAGVIRAGYGDLKEDLKKGG